jgi:hypothetical protein
VEGIDVASYQTRDLAQYFERFPQIEHVVARFYVPGERPPQQHSIDQVKSALRWGKTVSAYIWLYPSGISPEFSVQAALELRDRLSLKLPMLWLDCETYDGVPVSWEFTRRAIGECKRLRQRCGIYTGKWFIDQYWGGQGFPEIPLWLAHYGYSAGQVPSNACPPWTDWVGHQFTSDPLDRNVFKEWVTVPE